MKSCYLIIAFILLSSTNLFAGIPTKPDSLKILNSKINEMQGTIDRVNSLVQTMNGSISNSLSVGQQSVSNSLSASQYALAVFAILITLSVVGFTILIAFMVNTTKKILKLNEEISLTIIKNKKDIELLSETIDNKISDLYKKLQDEEVKDVLNTLSSNPSKFDDYYDILFSRKSIPVSYFDQIKEILLSIPNKSYLKATKLLFEFFDVNLIFSDSKLKEMVNRTINYIELDEEKHIAIIDYFSKLDSNKFSSVEKEILNIYFQSTVYPDNLTVYQQHIVDKLGVNYLQRNAKCYVGDESIENKFIEFVSPAHLKYSKSVTDQLIIKELIINDFVSYLTTLGTPNLIYLTNTSREQALKLYDKYVTNELN